MTIHDQENILWEEWAGSYPAQERENFVMDGLCHNGPLCNEGWNALPGDEEELWEKAQRKVLFLMKDPNSNPGEDYRAWPWRGITHKFFKTIFNWLQGLSEIKPGFTPLLENGFYLSPANQTVLRHPLAIVNVKKISGGASVGNHTLREYAGRDAAFIRRQVRSILMPNIVVCGGGSGCLLDIAKEFIYPDLTFSPINSWCHYCKDPELLLIDSWHPSSRIPDSQKIDGMMQAVAGFMAQTHSGIFR